MLRFLKRLLMIGFLGLFALGVIGFFLPRDSVAVRTVDIEDASLQTFLRITRDADTYQLWLPFFYNDGIPYQADRDGLADRLVFQDGEERGMLTLGTRLLDREVEIHIERQKGERHLTLFYQPMDNGVIRVSLAERTRQGGFPWISRVFEPVRRGRKEALLDNALQNLSILVQEQQYSVSD